MIEDEQRVQLPRLLQTALDTGGNTLREQARLHPDKLSPSLRTQPLSTATMILPESDPDIAMHDWMELYNQHGSCGIFRVVDIQPTYGKNRSITLNHALDVLNDAVYPSNTEEFDGTVSAFLTKILGAQTQTLGGTPYWQVGTIADTGTWHHEFNYDNILDLVKEITDEHEEYYYTFDFSVFPWRLNMVARNDTVLTEMRLNRNIDSCKVTENDSEQCTRLYLSVTTKTTVTEKGKTAGKKSTTTFEVHNDATGQANYGVICKTAGIETDKVPASQKSAWVQAYFERHRDPSIQISIDGRDVKERTGESIDEMHLGRVCRVALPKYRTTFLERIVEVTYPDALRLPEKVTISMANKRQTTEDNIASAQKEAKKARSGGGRAKQKADNNETEIERQKIIYNVDVTKTNEYFRVLATESEWNELKQAYETSSEGLLNVTARNITGAVGRIGIVEGKVSTIEGSTVWINRENVAAVTGKMSVDSNGDLVVNDGSGLYVSRNGSKLGVWDSGNLTAGIVIGKITDSNGKLSTSITIDADNVYIGNQKSTTVIAGKCSLDDVSADYISGKIASLSVLRALILQVTSIGASDSIAASGAITGATVSASNNMFIDDTPVGSAVYNVRITGPTNNVYTLQKQTIKGSGWTDCGTFSRATSLSGSWSGRNYTVTADPQGNTKTGIVYNGLVPTGTVSKTGKNVKKTFIVYSDDGNGDADSIIMQHEVSIDASSVYTDGWDAARAKVVPPSEGTDTSFTVKVPSATEGEQQTYTFTIQKGQTPGSSGYASVALSGTVVGRIEIGNWYTAGYNDGKPVSGTAGGRTSGVSALVHDFTITKGDGTTATLQINVSNIYATARSGYTQGTFTQATVTPQGVQDTVFVEMTTGGYDYYKAKAAANYYPGDGGEFTVQGDSAGTIYKRKTSGSLRLSRYSSSSVELFIYERNTYYSVGNHVWWYQSNSGTYYYLGDGSDDTLYKAGTVKKHDRGTRVSVTAIDTSTKKHLVSTTRYKAGTPDSTTYYTKS